MRVIGGQARGRKLKAPDTDRTRPVTDRAREAVFSSIGTWVEDAVVADLYAGSGSFGLEALSRGARSVVFVENGRRALAALRENVETIGLGGRVVASSVEAYLARSDGLFHLVFMDPPWTQGTDQMELDLLKLDPLLAADAEVVVSRRHRTDPGNPRNMAGCHRKTLRRYQNSPVREG